MARPSKLHFHKGSWISTINGQTHYFGSDERQARADWYLLMAQANAIDPTDRPTTINGAVVAFIALNDKRCWREWLARFRAFAGRESLAAIAPDLLTRYAIHLRGCTFTRGKDPTPRHISPKTARHYVAAAASVLRHAIKNRWLQEMPERPKLPKPVRKPRDVATPRLREILSELPDRAGAVLRFIAATGCRPSEACALRWEHVRVAGNVAVIPAHKTAESTGEPRTIYLTPDALEILDGLSSHEGPVFLSGRGAPYTPAGLRTILRRRGATPYQLRHSFAQRATDGGVATADLARLLGHKSERTTGFYRQVRDERAVDIAQKLRLLPAAG